MKGQDAGTPAAARIPTGTILCRAGGRAGLGESEGPADPMSWRRPDPCLE